MSQYRPERGKLRGYGDVDVLAFDEINIGRIIDERDDSFGPKLFASIDDMILASSSLVIAQNTSVSSILSSTNS